MIFKSSFPNAPDVSVVISGVAVNYSSIESVKVDLSENMHDIATIKFVGLPTNAVTDYIGAPVFISIANNPARVSNFYGYVSFVEPEIISRRGLINDSPIQKANVVCMGASYDMTNQKNKIWENISLPSLVEYIASTYNYTFSVPSDYFVWKRLLQTQQSDWQLLKEACNAIGYYMTTNGTHIHVYDPYKAIARQLPYAELKSVRGSNGDPSYVPGRIMEFSGTFGDITKKGRIMDIEMIGIDSSGTVITADSGDASTGLGEAVSSRYRDQIGTNVTSIEMLNKYATAAVKSYYPFDANVVVTGIADPVPGSVVKIDNYDSDFDGYWLVRGVSHTVTRSNFLTELSISTDSKKGILPEVSPTAAFTDPPSPRLTTDNRWESSIVFQDVYV